MNDNNSENKQSLKDEDSFNYDVTKTNSATDCTGLMPTPPQNEYELNSYLDVYEMRPSVPPKNNKK